eukprot:1084038-Prymnesium_polylepis.1
MRGGRGAHGPPGTHGTACWVWDRLRCNTLCSLARPTDLRTRRHVPVSARQHTAVAHGNRSALGAH